MELFATQSADARILSNIPETRRCPDDRLLRKRTRYREFRDDETLMLSSNAVFHEPESGSCRPQNQLLHYLVVLRR
jgi:hypothetical protein